MEFMGFSCAEFVNKALLSLMLLVWTTAASAQTRSDANAVRQNESPQEQQSQQPQNAPSQTPPAQTPDTPTPNSQILPPPIDATASARQAAPPRNGELLQLTFQQALDLARKNATQFLVAVT